jgi:hypothetical protein
MQQRIEQFVETLNYELANRPRPERAERIETLWRRSPARSASAATAEAGTGFIQPYGPESFHASE